MLGDSHQKNKKNFNSRLSKETNVNKNKEEFQLTSQQGDEHSTCDIEQLMTDFNSRLRKETNVAVRGLKDKLDHYFNSRLRKETNLLPLLLQLVDFAFQFTSPQ